MAITGVNFAIAETGSIVLVENEGNASLTSQLPPVYVGIMGREKVIPTLADLGGLFSRASCAKLHRSENGGLHIAYHRSPGLSRVRRPGERLLRWAA